MTGFSLSVRTVEAGQPVYYVDSGNNTCPRVKSLNPRFTLHAFRALLVEIDRAVNASCWKPQLERSVHRPSTSAGCRLRFDPRLPKLEIDHPFNTLFIS